MSRSIIRLSASTAVAAAAVDCILAFSRITACSGGGTSLYARYISGFCKLITATLVQVLTWSQARRLGGDGVLTGSTNSGRIYIAALMLPDRLQLACKGRLGDRSQSCRTTL